MKQLVAIGTAAVVILSFSGTVPCQAGQGTVTYTHDAAGRMVDAAYSSGGVAATVTYTYDDGGNLINRRTETEAGPDGTMFKSARRPPRSSLWFHRLWAFLSRHNPWAVLTGA